MSARPSPPQADVGALPPVSREALEANLRSTHANLNFCIEQREALSLRVAALEAAEPYQQRIWRHLPECSRDKRTGEGCNCGLADVQAALDPAPSQPAQPDEEGR